MGLVLAKGGSLGHMETWHATPWTLCSEMSFHHGSVFLVTNMPSTPSRCQDRGHGVQKCTLLNEIHS